MTDSRRQGVIWTAAGLALLAGIVWTIFSVADAPRREKRIRRKLADLEQLSRLAAEAGRIEGAVARFEALETKRPAALADVLREAIPGVEADVRQRQSDNLVGGWAARRADVLFADVPLDAVGQFLQSAEQKRPPWRLTECHITASGRADGAGRATLVMEALEKAGTD